LLQDYHAIGERLRTTVYSQTALFPPTPWLGGAPPAAPKVLSVGGNTISIAPGDPTHIAWWLIQALGADGRWRTSIRHATERQIGLGTLGDLGGHRVAVTAVDRAGQTSDPTLFDVP
jgi:hypothetical protein